MEAYPVWPPITGPSMGEATSADGSIYTVNAIKDPHSVGGFFGPDPGNRLVAVDITQEGVEAGDPYNPVYFHLQTTDDFYYSCSALGAPEPGFGSGELAAGQKVRGWIACEVEEDATVAALWVKAAVFGKATVVLVP